MLHDAFEKFYLPHAVVTHIDSMMEECQTTCKQDGDEGCGGVNLCQLLHANYKICFVL